MSDPQDPQAPQDPQDPQDRQIGGQQGGGASSGPPPGPVRDLAVGPTVRDVFLAIFRNLPALLRLMALPAALQAGITLIVLSGIESGEITMQDLASFLIPLLLFSMLPMAVFGYGWQRYLLLGAGGAPLLWPREIKAVMKLFFSLLGILIVSSLAGALASNLGIMVLGLPTGGSASLAQFLPIALISLGVSLWLLLRLGLVLPARALQESYSLRHSWNQTKGQSMALLLAAIATLPPVYIVSVFLSSLTGGVAGVILSAVGILLVQAAFFALLASAFRQISGWVPPN